MVEERAVDYKKCVVGFVVRVNKGNNTKGGLKKKYSRDSLSCKPISIEMNHSTQSEWTKISNQSRRRVTCQSIK
jgi:hypothetical protein